MSERLEDILEARRTKLDNLKKAGIDPYPSTTARTHTNGHVLEHFEQLSDQTVTLVGRIKSWRGMGKLIFAHVDDGTGKIQILFKEDQLSGDQFKMLIDNYDLGDFIEATGTLFVTKTGEKTLQATSYKILAKSLLPLPSEHYGLQDTEMRLRKRYLDILTNPEVKNMFIKKHTFWAASRDFLHQNGFIETQIPVLESVPGGAEAEPFITHHNALDRDFFLRISLELPLKKLLVAGFEKVYEIGRVFRNEGIDTEHLQEFTTMEFYWAYGDFEKLMNFTQGMVQSVVLKIFGTQKTKFNETEIDWSGNWPKRDYFDLFKQYTGLDLNVATEKGLKSYADQNGIKYEPIAQRGRLIDLIFKKKIRILEELFMQPCFLINQPLDIEPLAKKHPQNPNMVQRMQIMAGCTELGKGFGELNDPIDQRERFEQQMKLREAGDKEAQMLDEDYLEAMEYGMPPAAGFAYGDRLFAILMNKSIRETVIFPPMKSEK
jgi:lysyl-tRNA synthetase, class II